MQTASEAEQLLAFLTKTFVSKKILSIPGADLLAVAPTVEPLLPIFLLRLFLCLVPRRFPSFLPSIVLSRAIILVLALTQQSFREVNLEAMLVLTLETSLASLFPNFFERIFTSFLPSVVLSPAFTLIVMTDQSFLAVS
jgi:hypothetical protein